MSFRSAAVALLLLATLSACGFHPLYGTRDGQETSLHDVAIGTIADRKGQQLRNLLIDRLYLQGRPQAPRYDLNLGLQESEVDLGIRKDATAARANLTTLATMTLTERGTGKTIMQAELRSTASYNKLDAQYATLAAQQNARERTLHELCDMIVGRIGLALKQAEKPASP